MLWTGSASLFFARVLYGYSLRYKNIERSLEVNIYWSLSMVPLSVIDSKRSWTILSFILSVLNTAIYKNISYIFNMRSHLFVQTHFSPIKKNKETRNYNNDWSNVILSYLRKKNNITLKIDKIKIQKIKRSLWRKKKVILR